MINSRQQKPCEQELWSKGHLFLSLAIGILKRYTKQSSNLRISANSLATDQYAVTGFPTMKPEVYFGNLPLDTTVIDLLRELRGYNFRTVLFVHDFPVGFAFVRFRNMREAHRAIHNLSEIHGWHVRPNFFRFRCYRCGLPGHRDRD